MKTIYLIGWLANAIILLLVVHPIEGAFIILQIFNMCIPTALLTLRMIYVHIEVDETKIPI